VFSDRCPVLSKTPICISQAPQFINTMISITCAFPRIGIRERRVVSHRPALRRYLCTIWRNYNVTVAHYNVTVGNTRTSTRVGYNPRAHRKNPRFALACTSTSRNTLLVSSRYHFARSLSRASRCESCVVLRALIARTRNRCGQADG
jgi:hypothetical protein